MTEAEWLNSTDPLPMLVFLRGPRLERLEPFFGRFARYVEFPDRRAPERVFRLFAVACCRRIAHLVSPDWVERAIQTFESLGDRPIDQTYASLPADGCLKALDVVERFARGEAGDEEVDKAIWAASETYTLFTFFRLSYEANGPLDLNLATAGAAAAEAIENACNVDECLDRVPFHAAQAMGWFAASRGESQEEAARAESALQCRLLREMFNPFAAVR
jgi:hypothetical protein